MSDAIPDTINETVGKKEKKVLPQTTTTRKPENSIRENDDEKNYNGLTMQELNEFIDDKFWIKIRKILFLLSILLFLIIFIVSILIIVYTPSCKPEMVPNINFSK